MVIKISLIYYFKLATNAQLLMHKITMYQLIGETKISSSTIFKYDKLGPSTVLEHCPNTLWKSCIY
jgi:hypothetical protein